MKKIVFLLMVIILFVIGCKKDEYDVDNSIFEEIATVEEIVITKYLTDINDYECKYFLRGEDANKLISVLNNLEGRKTVAGMELENFKYAFIIGELNIRLSNGFCKVNNTSYRTEYNYDEFFSQFIEFKDDADILFSEIVNLENVTTIDITRILSETKLKMFLRKEKNVESFIEKIKVIRWKEIDEINASLIYELKIGSQELNVYKDKNGFYYISVNEKEYMTNGTLVFLDEYTKDNTDENSSGWLPWI